MLYREIKSNIKKEPLLTRDDEKDVIKRYVNGDEDAGNILFKKYLKFVLGIVSSYKVDEHLEEDIFQEAVIGFMQGLSNYDGSSSLSSYVKYYIDRAISDFMLGQRTPLKVLTTKDARKVYFNRYKYQNEQGFISLESKKQMAEDLEIPLDTVCDALDRIKTSAVHNVITDDGPIPVSETLPCEWNGIDDFEDERDFQQRKTTVYKLLDQLTPRQKEIIMQRYYDNEPKTLSQMSEMYGVSLQRIQQIEKDGLKKLKTLV